MARYRVGQRVRIPHNNPHAPFHLYGCGGTVTTVAPPMQMFGEGIATSQVEQQYMVRFDGETSDRIVEESCLQPIDES
ncbi:MAG: hypothetical protein HY665_02620 [Chloroflexi bacterium]|nr:hypothetical protein [Chloroflexota bacterium]